MTSPLTTTVLKTVAGLQKVEQSPPANTFGV